MAADDVIRLTRVNHVTYNVTDKARALRFWEDVLGVRQIPSQVDNENIVWLQLPSGTMVHLIEKPDAPSKPSHHGAFEVADIEAAARALEAKGATCSPISTRRDGQRAFKVYDPDGNEVEICTKSGFGVL
jgi:catechol 2,3-dioxygenase-like lactoylglutathione lyase family enzyme